MGRTGQGKWEQRDSFASNTNNHGKKARMPRHSPSWKVTTKYPEQPNPNDPVLKHVSPSDSMIPPPDRWRLYIFKDLVELEMVSLEGKDSYLFGRDRRIADIPTDHESCSKQHAVIQFRAKTTPVTTVASGSLSEPVTAMAPMTLMTRSSGRDKRQQPPPNFKEERMELNARPYLIDLDSVNGTTLNGFTIEPRRYYELRGNDLIRIADSSRDYVMLEIPPSM